MDPRTGLKDDHAFASGDFQLTTWAATVINEQQHAYGGGLRGKGINSNPRWEDPNKTPGSFGMTKIEKMFKRYIRRYRRRSGYLTKFGKGKAKNGLTTLLGGLPVIGKFSTPGTILQLIVDTAGLFLSVIGDYLYYVTADAIRWPPFLDISVQWKVTGVSKVNVEIGDVGIISEALGQDYGFSLDASVGFQIGNVLKAKSTSAKTFCDGLFMNPQALYASRKIAVMFYGRVFFLSSLGSPHVRPVGRVYGEPNEIESTAIGVTLNGSQVRRPFQRGGWS